MDSLGVYLQFPFCASKCSFCNFSSRVAPSSVFDVYCRALQEEVERLPASYPEAGIALSDRETSLLTLPVDTVYLGGGSPSLLGAERLRQIVSVLESSFNVNDTLEFTLE